MPFVKTVESYQQGARTLPGRYYTAPEVFAEERERIFRRNWICVGRDDALADPGDYRLVEIAGESIIVLRDHSGERHAYYNVCRHRGTRLCEAPTGRLSETIQCPYHAWTYALDGSLIGAPHMHEVEGFDKRAYPLHAVALAEWEGFLFANLDPQATPEGAPQWFSPLRSRFANYNLPALRTVRRIEYDVKANWKLILQNYNECLHCPMIHPELSTKLPYTSGANDLVEGPFLGGYMEIKAPNESATLTGRACALPLGKLPAEDQRRAFYYALFPTMMLSLHPDYAVFYTVWPVEPLRSRVICEWMVHPDAPAAAGYNIGDAEEFWDRTNRQDWHICEQSQLGISSRAYVPGPYSPRESIPAAWDRTYLKFFERDQ
ncbi:MAG: (2Fe-2S)-binding protein [Gemmatimonadetes bacterium 13_1_40CM_3_65_8]|nr:MAG: (2Fe-2S)-binding protein [Gemmatimonadetes bacterium 13_1_40CM_4_65_7]OLC99386.1 MAG: (2Fe-2S)-binding protein [Gemmatimonadetes bacterium 13_1_40CM_3_65_8]